MQRKIPQTFLKNTLSIIFTHRKHICAVKGLCIWVFPSGCVKFALSFLRIVTLGGKLLKIFMPA
jgi:hypothetical protein